MTTAKTHFDPTLLATFVAVVEVGSFSGAARRLRLRQSTVSQRVARLEAAIGHKLITRNTHQMSLTRDGNAMVEFARGIIDAHERARRYFDRSRSGRERCVRLGAGADFAMLILPKILPELRQRHPDIAVEVRIGAKTPGLLKDLEVGALDLAVIKRRPGERPGRAVRREKLVWIGRDNVLPPPDAPVPLVLLDEPSMTRSIAIDSLERAGRRWQISCSSSNANGLRAAVLAGMGVTVQSDSILAPELAGMVLDRGLPALGFVEYAVVLPNGGGSRAAKLMAKAIFAASGCS